MEVLISNNQKKRTTYSKIRVPLHDDFQSHAIFITSRNSWENKSFYIFSVFFLMQVRMGDSGAGGAVSVDLI